MKLIMLFSFLFSVHSFSQEITKIPTANKKLEDKDINFIEKVYENYEYLKKSKFDNSECVEFISDKIKKIDNLTSNSFFPKTPESIQALKDNGIKTVETLFEIREIIRERFNELQSKKKLNYECLQSIKASTRYIRFMEEMLMEWLVENKVISNYGPHFMEGISPQILISKKFPEYNKRTKLMEKIKPGDVFMIRGKSYVSAMIARIGDVEMQYSHLAIIGLDKKKQMVAVEALIPYGSKITPLKKWLAQTESRVVHFRFKDAVIAEESAKAAYELAEDYIEKHNQTIPYDFKMNAQDQSQIFCAELIENAFLKGSKFTVHLPDHKTLATKFKSTIFLKSMGIESDELFSPGDLEFDSHFDLVEDYRYLGKEESSDEFTLLRKVRMQDAIIQSVYNWMITENYQFVDNYVVNAKAYLAKAFRYLGFFEVKLPKHMPMDSLKTIVQFEEISHVLEKPLFSYEKEFYKKNGHSLHFQEMLMALNEFKKKECKSESSDLNKLFKPIQCL